MRCHITMVNEVKAHNMSLVKFPRLFSNFGLSCSDKTFELQVKLDCAPLSTNGERRENTEYLDEGRTTELDKYLPRNDDFQKVSENAQTQSGLLVSCHRALCNEFERPMYRLCARYEMSPLLFSLPIKCTEMAKFGIQSFRHSRQKSLCSSFTWPSHHHQVVRCQVSGKEGLG
jgi:hypothetical protein